MRRKLKLFLLLLWKNYVIQKRKVFTTVLEIGNPTLFALILILIRLRVTGELKTNKTWKVCEKWDRLNTSLPVHIAYTPNNTAVNRVMDRLRDSIPSIRPDDFGYKKEDQMVDFLLYNDTVLKTYLGGLVFADRFSPSGDQFLPDITYKIRLSSVPRNAGSQKFLNPRAQDRSWTTQYMFPRLQRVGPREKKDTCGGSPGYVREGFLALLNAVNMGLLRELTNGTMSERLDELTVELRRHPYPAYNDDNFILVIQKQIPHFFMFSFVLVAFNIVKDIVYEKEKKLKESMKMMGMNNYLHWAAWFLKYLLFMLIIVGIMTLFLCIPTDKGPVIGYTNPTVLLVFLITYAICTISYCFAVSVFFSKANSGAAVGGIVFFVTYIPYFLIQPRYNTLSWTQKILTSLIPNVAMAYGSQVIGMFEGTGEGVQWSNIGEGVSIDDNFTMLNVIVMLLVDTAICGLITWYVEAVFPGEYGVSQRWYFLFTRAYWCGTRPDKHVPDDKAIAMGQAPEYFETDPVGIRPGIRIRNLKKEFKSGDGKKVAVSGMTLDMYDGQITALLGHNGAGKTTTMSMLTGFIEPTSGTAYVNGYDIREDIASVREILGLCPQHDILFDSLTVEEHLRFFGKLKGCSSAELPRAVDAMLASTNLEHKRHEQSRQLSGGMKRKLSVAIALIGGSKIVILDEPSSGLDPDARRQIWTILQENRAGRTMVLTTHFMDEADLLGDRIAIMSDGVVKCCGSSLFLKNKYVEILMRPGSAPFANVGIIEVCGVERVNPGMLGGAGYHMVIVKDPRCNVHQITSIVEKYVPQGKLEHNVGAELSYILPHESSNRFEELFSELEVNKAELGIASYGASVTTMEEVFLRVGEGSQDMVGRRVGSRENSVNRDQSSSSSASVTDDSENERMPLLTKKVPTYVPERSFRGATSFTLDIVKNTGLVLYLQQFYAMLIKRVLYTVRNKILTVVQLTVPLFFLIAPLIVLKTFPGPQDSPPLNLTIHALGDNVVVYALKPNNSEDANLLAQTYVHQFEWEDRTKVISVNNETGFKNNCDIVAYLLKEGHSSIGSYNMKYLVAADFHPFDKNQSSIMNATAYFNNQAFHSPAISMVALYNAILQFITNSTDYQLSTINHPLPRTETDRVKDEMDEGTIAFTIAINILFHFGMSFLTTSFILFIVKERAVMAKHQQLMSGASIFTFWPATFCWDMVNYLVPALCLIFALWAFNIDAFIVDGHIFHVALLFFLYGFAMLPFMYLWSFLFTVPATGFVWLTMFNILSGEATLLAVGILRIPELGLTQLSKALEWVFLILLPSFCLGQGLPDYYYNYQYGQIFDTYCLPFPFIHTKEFCMAEPNPCCYMVTGNCGNLNCVEYNPNMLGWEANGIGRMLIFLTIQCIAYPTLLFLIESQLTHKLWQLLSFRSRLPTATSSDSSLVQEDDDVAKERARLANTDNAELMSSEVLLLRELSKSYGANLAVNQISVGIPHGECFGLLGINGAGKTTTFKMLTGDESVSAGDAYLGGHSVLTNIAQVRESLGYCPQFDALIDHMTGREMLYMFARLRGIQRGQIAEVVDDLLHALLLVEHADKLVLAYSGGNKRKLSTAIALVGNPAVIFLDEPTTGMDPMARRFLWDTLSSIRAAGRTLVLTTHSMEECEALCTRLAIMVNGQFKCLGSPQHLKGKFGEGYTLLARVGLTPGHDVPDPQPLMEFIEQTFPCCIRKDIHQGMVHYHITDTSLTWAEIFGTMERAKADFNIEDYSVSQTTLEQVFINFAHAQLPPSEPSNGCCKGFCFACNLRSSCCGPRVPSLVDDDDNSVAV